MDKKLYMVFIQGKHHFVICTQEEISEWFSQEEYNRDYELVDRVTFEEVDTCDILTLSHYLKE